MNVCHNRLYAYPLQHLNILKELHMMPTNQLLLELVPSHVI